MSRRALLLGGAAATAGCAADPGPAPRARADVPTPRPTPTPPAPTSPPRPAPYLAPPGDALPAFKQAAGRFAQALATYDLAAAPEPLRTAGYIGKPQELATNAAPLRVPARWSRAEVEFVQYGGLSPVSPAATSGVALVVLRQVLHDQGGGTTILRRTLDLRLRQDDGIWQVERLASAGGSPLARPQQLGPTAQRVLDDQRIDLPDSARWDIYSGQIAESLLLVMLRLADLAPLRATVLKTGHPERVVDGRAAPPISAHWRGRAVDIHSLDDVPVAEAAPQVIRRVMQAAGAMATVGQVGGPEGFDFDAGRRRYLTNLVHADHLHIAVRGGGA